MHTVQIKGRNFKFKVKEYVCCKMIRFGHCEILSFNGRRKLLTLLNVLNFFSGQCYNE